MEEHCESSTLEQKEEFQIALSSFFNTYEPQGKEDELPSRNYMDTIRSHLRTIIKKKTEGKIDICDQIQMPKFHVSLL